LLNSTQPQSSALKSLSTAAAANEMNVMNVSRQWDAV